MFLRFLKQEYYTSTYGRDTNEFNPTNCQQGLDLLVSAIPTSTGKGSRCDDRYFAPCTDVLAADILAAFSSQAIWASTRCNGRKKTTK